jgi:hypothetical protein
MVAVAGCEKPDPIVERNDEEESALRVTSSPFIIFLIFFLYFLMILGSSHGRIGERENLHALPHLVRPRSLDAGGEKSLRR